ncbi:MAG: hypothetical protein EKK45_27865 [Curvibacter sp.]|nr:MAG: hypothetical protein EKK45_27865 [Curvibacter sp.]
MSLNVHYTAAAPGILALTLSLVGHQVVTHSTPVRAWCHRPADDDTSRVDILPVTLSGVVERLDEGNRADTAVQDPDGTVTHLVSLRRFSNLDAFKLFWLGSECDDDDAWDVVSSKDWERENIIG